VRLFLRILWVVAVTAAGFLLAKEFGGGAGAIAAVVLSFFGAISFFFADQLESVTWASRGMSANVSPATAFRFLGILVWVLAIVCMLFWRT